MVNMHQSGADVNVTGTQAVPLRTWVHVAFTWDGTACRLFLNGQLEGEVQTSRVPVRSDYPVYLARHATNAVFTEGRMDCVRFLSAALSPQEVMARYRQLVGPALSIQREPTGLRIWLMGAVGDECQIQARDSLSSGSWTPVATIHVTQERESWLDPDSGTGQTRFYRVQRLAP